MCRILIIMTFKLRLWYCSHCETSVASFTRKCFHVKAWMSQLHVLCDSEYELAQCLFFVVLLKLQVLRRLSELISPAAAGASNVCRMGQR